MVYSVDIKMLVKYLLLYNVRPEILHIDNYLTQTNFDVHFRQLCTEYFQSTLKLCLNMIKSFLWFSGLSVRDVGSIFTEHLVPVYFPPPERTATDNRAQEKRSVVLEM